MEQRINCHIAASGDDSCKTATGQSIKAGQRKENNLKTTKKLVLLSLLLSQALVLSIVESWIPVPVPVPGVKLGLANIVTMTIIAFMGASDTFVLVILRCLLSSMFSGGISVFLFSVSGGLLSAVVMLVLYKKFSKIFSVVGISIAGAISHNIGQIIVAAVMMKEISVFGYLPVLFISGIITGCFVGLCSNFIIEALRKTNIFNN